MSKRFLPASLTAVSVLLAFVLLMSAAPPAPSSALAGRRAPSFSLPDSGFMQHDLLDYRGRWLLIDFMKTDCPHCKALTQVLESKKAAWGAKVSVLCVVVAPPENQATVGKYITETKTTSPIVFDQGQMAISYFKATPQNPSFDTPHLFAVNPAGMIVRDWAELAVELPTFPAELDALVSGSK